MSLDGTYAGLKASVADFLHRADLTGIIPDLITIGEKRIFRNVRCRVMESTFSGTIASGVIAVPSDYLELKFAYISASPTSYLAGASASQIYAKYPNRAAEGKPVLIGREGSNFIFGPYPDSAYAVAGTYYAKPTVVSSSANALYVANPDLYLYAALCEAAPYIGDDPRIAVWEAKLNAIFNQIAYEASSEEGSSGGLSVKAA